MNTQLNSNASFPRQGRLSFAEFVARYGQVSGVRLDSSCYLNIGERLLVKPVTDEDRAEYQAELFERAGMRMEAGATAEEAARLAVEELGPVEVWEYVKRANAGHLIVYDCEEFEPAGSAMRAAEKKKRLAVQRRSRVGSLAYHRLQTSRAATAGDRAGASYHTEQAAMFARVLRAKPRTPDLESTDLRDEIHSWFVMAEVIASEAHLTAEHYYWA